MSTIENFDHKINSDNMLIISGKIIKKSVIFLFMHESWFKIINTPYKRDIVDFSQKDQLNPKFGKD